MAYHSGTSDLEQSLDELTVRVRICSRESERSSGQGKVLGSLVRCGQQCGSYARH